MTYIFSIKEDKEGALRMTVGGFERKEPEDND
jgi:hypothetical protein